MVTMTQQTESTLTDGEDTPVGDTEVEDDIKPFLISKTDNSGEYYPISNSRGEYIKFYFQKDVAKLATKLDTGDDYPFWFKHLSVFCERLNVTLVITQSPMNARIVTQHCTVKDHVQNELLIGTEDHHMLRQDQLTLGKTFPNKEEPKELEKVEKLQNLQKLQKTIENTKSSKKLEKIKNLEKHNEQLLRKISKSESTADVTLDSSSPIHLTNRKDWMINYQKVDGKMGYAGVGQNSAITILGQGFLRIKNGKEPDILVKCYHSLDDDVTIISLEKLWEETGYTLVLADGILYNKNNLIKTFTKDNNIWTNSKLLIHQPSQEMRAIRPLNPLISTREMSADECHFRLQHISYDAIEQSVKNNLFKDVEKMTHHNCSDCLI
ncbi:hypothetical protein DAKH74_050330 [Maudiozyma humilis]|uniref:Uncharacterized protein n=1 Tax=Maudiozyma humilis TaxID=51915 RepID=A0AAV5S4P5_MAUHU|nr:hypothetical protein DAKH74_050330 [Kazachstania humilis]